MPPPVFNETQSVIQQPRSHWPRVGRWALELIAVVFPWPFVVVGLLMLPFSKAKDPNATGLWGDVRWILGLQFLLGLMFYVTMGNLIGALLDHETPHTGRLNAWVSLSAYGFAFSYWLWTVIAMFRRSRRFTLLYSLQWLVIAAAVTIDYGYYAWLQDLPADEIRALVDWDVKTKIVGSIVFGGAGLWLLLTSRQSKNTFIR